MLLLSEVFDPDWRVAVDGGSAEAVGAVGIRRGVYLNGGTHDVVFTYWPRGLGWGIGVTAAALASLIVLWGIDKRLAKGRSL